MRNVSDGVAANICFGSKAAIRGRAVTRVNRVTSVAVSSLTKQANGHDEGVDADPENKNPRQHQDEYRERILTAHQA